jgi:hypothetical protein
MALVRRRTIQTERHSLVGEVSATFSNNNDSVFLFLRANLPLGANCRINMNKSVGSSTDL